MGLEEMVSVAVMAALSTNTTVLTTDETATIVTMFNSFYQAPRPI